MVDAIFYFLQRIIFATSFLTTQSIHIMGHFHRQEHSTDVLFIFHFTLGCYNCGDSRFHSGMFLIVLSNVLF